MSTLTFPTIAATAYSAMMVIASTLFVMRLRKHVSDALELHKDAMQRVREGIKDDLQEFYQIRDQVMKAIESMRSDEGEDWKS